MGRIAPQNSSTHSSTIVTVDYISSLNPKKGGGGRNYPGAYQLIPVSFPKQMFL
jgi:hypothetical protein